jgi:hypothetical protein
MTKYRVVVMAPIVMDITAIGPAVAVSTALASLDQQEIAARLKTGERFKSYALACEVDNDEQSTKAN